MDEYKCLNKLYKKEVKKKNPLIKMLNICLCTTLLFMINLVLCKSNNEYKNFIYKNIYSNNLSFGKIETTLQKYLGNIIPKTSKNIKPVFNDELVYNYMEELDGGVKINVDKNTLINSFESGIVVFNGTKDNLGKTLIIEQIDGNQAWYINIDTSNLNIYDYIEKGQIIGPSLSDNIKIYFKNKGENVDYKKYIS